MIVLQLIMNLYVKKIFFSKESTRLEYCKRESVIENMQKASSISMTSEE